MEFKKNSYGYMNDTLRELRLKGQKENNRFKPALMSDDVLETKDFVFLPLRPGNRVGDSGNLLMARHRRDQSERYLVKHEYCDCPCNEFVYAKLAGGMGLRIPESKLFHISEEDKRRILATGYGVGARYLDVKEADPSYGLIRECAKNWEDFHSFAALYILFLEIDSFEILLAEDGFIYRVDTASSFVISDLILSYAGLNIEVNGINVQEMAKRQAEERMKQSFWEYVDMKDQLENHVARYGEESRKGFLRPFYGIQELTANYIDDFLNTLCYFYPDFIGDCYKRFICAAQEKAREFLNQKI